MPISPRFDHVQTLYTMRFDFTFTSVQGQPGNNTVALSKAALAAGVQIGSLPPGCVPISVNGYTDILFNNGTNNLYSVGYTATGTDLVNGASMASQVAVITAAPIAAIATAKAATAAGGTPIFVSTSQTGTAATTGQATIIVQYAPNLG